MVQPWEHIFEELQHASPRAAAILAAAVVEFWLERAIKRFLCEMSKKKTDDLFEHLGPLSSLSAKINLGFGLGLFGPETQNDLHKIRGIRNAFAHDLSDKTTEEHLTFHSPTIAKECDNLNCPGIPIEKPRGRFIETVMNISEHLGAEYQDRERLALSSKALP